MAVLTCLGILAVMTAVIVVGYATGITPRSSSLGTKGAAVSRCDTDGFSVQQNLSGSNIASVTIGQIAAGCAGGTLSVAVNNGTANSTGSAVVPSGGGTMTVALASAVALKDAVEIDVAVSGP
jgi:hypothetical protein